MAYRASLFAVLLLLTGVAHTAEPSDADLQLERSTIAVSDLDRALTLYRDVLGLSVERIVEHDAERILGGKEGFDGEAMIREAWLVAEPSNQTIGLMEIRGTGSRERHGSVNLWLKLFGYEAAANEAQELGLFVSEQQSGENFDSQPVRERIIEDWDGNRILIYRLENRELQAGECVAFGETARWEVFDDKQFFVEGSQIDSRYLVTTRNSCRNALRGRGFEVAGGDGLLCHDGPRIKFRSGNLRYSCGIKRIESVPTCSEAHRRAVERRPDWRRLRNTPHYVCVWE